METKKIVDELNDFCESFFAKNVVEMDISIFKEAAERLEELEKISENWCNLNDENMELLRKYREDIAELKQQLSEQQPEWVSVEDRLPEENGTFIIAIKDSFCPHFTGFDAESNEFCGNVFRKNDVTHWMPLPEPPKPKEPSFKDVFLKAFPKAVVLPKSGAPLVCAKQVFPQLGDDESPCDMCCAVCWNQPYFEPQGEGEADV